MKVLETAAKKGAWVVLVNIEAGQVLMAKRGKINNAGQWNFFGGNVDAGESNKEGALRELYEESRLKLKRGDLTKLMNTGGYTFFMASVKKSIKKKIRLNEESEKVKWFDVTDLPKNINPPTKALFRSKEFKALIKSVRKEK